MRPFLLALALLAAGFSLWGTAAAATPSYATWRITKDHWGPQDERGFGAFVAALGASGCSSAESCLRSAANPWRGSDGGFIDIDADCAKFPYLLRAYYAWKNGLPFGYADAVKGDRFSRNGNRVVSRAEIIDHGSGNGSGGIDPKRAILAMMDNVFSGTYRIDAGSADGMPSDFYSPALQPGSIHPGSVIYDPNGHVGIVWQVDASGRIFYMDAHPDFTVSRSVYGAQFGQSPISLGGGLKNWRPLRLEGARLIGGAFVGGHVVVARQREIADFSLVQYTGTDGQGHFAYNGAPLGFYEFVRAAVSGGKTDYNPVFELQATMKTLCNDLNDRSQAVQQAVANGIAAKLHPSRLPDNIYLSDDGEWEAYATPARDARLRAAFFQFRRDMAHMIGLWLQRDPRIVYDGQFLKDDLMRAYDAQSEACHITFLTDNGRGDKRPVTMNFEGMARHLTAMSFDPYMCEALRWGDGADCADGEEKRRWYAREAPMRAEIGRDEGANGDVQAVTQADFDIRGLIVGMPSRSPFVQRFPD